MARNTENYGQFYFCIKVAKSLAELGEIYVMADRVETTPNGSLAMITERDDKPSFVNLLIAADKWAAVYAASVIDGAAVAVEHWEEEIVGGSNPKTIWPE